MATGYTHFSDLAKEVQPPAKGILSRTLYSDDRLKAVLFFGTQDHGALLRLAGQKRKAVQFVVGNPLLALQMTQHDLRAGLYAPLRVLLYEDERGRTCLEYDRPSSLFGQFNDDRIAPVATLLDRKLEALVGAAVE